MRSLNIAMFILWCEGWVLFGMAGSDLLLYHRYRDAGREFLLWFCIVLVTYLAHSFLRRAGFKNDGGIFFRYK